MALIVLVAWTPTRATEPDRSRSEDVRLSSTDHGEVVIPVVIGGEGPYPFILDTGSSHTAVSQTLASALGAVPVAKAPMATSMGSMSTLVVRLPDVAVGSAHVESLLATVLPPAAASWLGHGISGVLGQDFLSQFD
jgi:predicted aspartyl protease